MKSILRTIFYLPVLLFLSWSDPVPPATGDKIFEILPAEKTGIEFQNVLAEGLFMNGLVDNYFYNGAGLAVADYNRDGLQDIFFLATSGPNKLYLNMGNMVFDDVSEQSGIAEVRGYPTGAASVDINADGWMDIYICNAGKFNDADDGISEDPEHRKNKLFINNGGSPGNLPSFREASAEYGLDIDLYSTQAAFFDYDRDGDLDMFLINHFPYDYGVEDITEFINTASPFTGDRLYRNDGGKFTEVDAGLTNNKLSCGLGVGVSDVNNDGWPDVYVSNDLPGKDELYINQGDGSFSKNSDRSIGHMPYASMGNDIADFNNDGWTDIYTLDMASEDNLNMKTSMKVMDSKLYNALSSLGLHHQYMFNALQLNNGIFNHDRQPVFSDIGQMAGMPATDWSWGPLAFDMDNDGLKDLHIANGIVRDLINLDYIVFKGTQQARMFAKEISPEEYVSSVLAIQPFRLRNDYFYRNTGQLSFEKMGPAQVDTLATCSNGSAYADLDNDGDLDIVVNNSGGNSFIYKNLSREKDGGNYLQFILEGPAGNPLGIGTRIVIHQESQIQVLEQYLSRGFLSSVTPLLHAGIGQDRKIPGLEVIWPDGKKQFLKKIKANRRITLTYDDARSTHDYSYDEPLMFEDITAESGLAHLHRENRFNDFGRETMLPHRMSGLGPALAVADVNDDGHDDFFIGGASGFAGTLYMQNPTGSTDLFSPVPNQPWRIDRNSEDVRACFFDPDNDGDMDLYVVSGGNEMMEGTVIMQDRLYENKGGGRFSITLSALPQVRESGGCVLPGDYDGDGDLDLFIGGRQIPGLYPLPASSYILRNESQPGAISFTDVTEEVAPMLKESGMVTDATWTDVNGDGSADLVIVGEWMAPRIFLNTVEGFKENKNSGISDETGWWNCISTGDFDGDGDMDFVAGNLGLNHNFRASHEWPFEVFAGDVDNNGSLDIVMAYYNEGILYPWHGLMRSTAQVPGLKYMYNSYKDFGMASVDDIYGRKILENTLHHKARNFASTYFENDGSGTFRSHALPSLAQIAPVNAVLAGDHNSDGITDLILAGNQYGSESEVTMADGGLGLFLAGDGKGGFKEVPALNSGLYLEGDIKQVSYIHIGTDRTPAIIAAKNSGNLQIVIINP